MKKQIAEIFATRTRDEWTAVFDGLEACVVPVLSPREAFAHPHHAARGAFVPRDANLLQPAPVPRFSRTEGEVAGPTPERGAHTRDVLAELGYAPEAIDDLAAAGAVAWP
jgi:alpha-methylacyl-CoA racemase